MLVLLATVLLAYVARRDYRIDLMRIVVVSKPWYSSTNVETGLYEYVCSTTSTIASASLA